MDDGTAKRHECTNEIVVERAHLDSVQRELDRLQVRLTTAAAEDRRLGLALLSIDPASQEAARRQILADEDARAVLAETARSDPERLDELDVLLARLRSRFAAEYAGWTPTMGKNRLGSVDGYPHISPGGLNAPTPIPAPPPSDRTGPRVSVGVLDTAIYPHEQLDGAFVEERSELLPAVSTTPRSQYAGHCTFVAGIIRQYAPGAVLDIHRTLGDDGTATAWDVARAIAAFAGTEARVLNMSFGCITADDRPPLLLERAVGLVGSDRAVVVAAGNHGQGDVVVRPAWPAAFDYVVAVGATDPDGKAATFSPHAPWVDLTAPGVEVDSTYLVGEVEVVDRPVTRFAGFANWSGTSFATGAVSGAIADLAARRRLTPREAVVELQDGNVRGIAPHVY